MLPGEDIKILLVEDSAGDAILTKMAFDNLETPHTITHVDTGEKAIAALMADGEFEGVSHPDLILLDINLPAMNGDEVLDIIKKNQDLKHIPVIVLSGSSSPKDIKHMYSHFASGYLSKPPDSASFIEAAEAIEKFWFKTNQLPARN